MRLRAVRPFRWAGEHVEPGTLLSTNGDDKGAILVSERDASLLVFAYGDCVLVGGGDSLSPPSALIASGDPVVQHRDPVSAKKGRR